MFYFIVITLLVTQNYTTHCGEKDPLLHEDKNEGHTVIPLDGNSFTLTTTSPHKADNLISHVAQIKEYLSTTDGLDADKRLFDEQKATTRWGFANTALVAHARSKITPSTTRTDIITRDPQYVQLLTDLIALSQTHDAEQRKTLCKGITVSMSGIVATGVITLIGKEFF